MSKYCIIFITLLIAGSSFSQEHSYVQELDLKGEWKFSIGDNNRWSSPDFNDKSWETMKVPSMWEDRGYWGYDGFAWYRITFGGSSFERNKNHHLILGYIDDADEVFFNGELIGKSGSFPPGFRTAFKARREYPIPSEVINYNGSNTIAVRVYDAHGEGGIVWGNVGIYSARSMDFDISLRGIWRFRRGNRTEWKEEDYNDEDWRGVSVPSPWEKQGYPDFDGFGWYRKQVHLTQEQASEPWIIVLGRIDDFDKAYVNGEYIGSTNDYEQYGRSRSFTEIRVYEISADILKPGRNVIAVMVEDMGNVGGMYDGPVGMIKKRDFSRGMLRRYGDRW